MGYAFSTLGAFALGMLRAWCYPPFAAMIHRTVSGLVNIYGYAAPLVIYLVLAVALTKFFEHGYARGTRGGLRAVLFMLLARCFALAFGLVFCGVVFHLPFTMHDKTGFGALHLVAELFTRAAFLSPMAKAVKAVS